MVAHFRRMRGYFGRPQGNFADPVMARGAEEEKQGTMIVPSNPCGLLAALTAGVAGSNSGRAESLFSGRFQ